MPDDQKTASGPIDQAALALYKKEALGAEVAEGTLYQSGSNLTGFLEDLDTLSDLFEKDKETIARLDKAITSLESEPQRQNKREDSSFAGDSLADSLLTASYRGLERMHGILDSHEQHLDEMREILDTAEQPLESSPSAVMQPERPDHLGEVVQTPAPATERELDPGNIIGEYPAVAETIQENRATRLKHRLPRVLRKVVPYAAAFALGLGVSWALSGDESAEPSYSTNSTISMATPEEALTQYNDFLESVGGELIVSVRQYRAFAEAAGEQATEAGICRAALGELYRAMAFRETDAIDEQQFADDLSFRCRDVDIESGHYRFVPYREAPQTGEVQ